MKAMSPMEKRVVKRMLVEGESQEAMAERLGRTKAEIRLYITRLENLRKNRITDGAGMTTRSDQLCWRCRIATGRLSRRTGEPCPWAEKGEPVEGWDAEMTRRQLTDAYGRRTQESWRIRRCPLFEEDETENDSNERR